MMIPCQCTLVLLLIVLTIGIFGSSNLANSVSSRTPSVVWDEHDFLLPGEMTLNEVISNLREEVIYLRKINQFDKLQIKKLQRTNFKLQRSHDRAVDELKRTIKESETRIENIVKDKMKNEQKVVWEEAEQKFRAESNQQTEKIVSQRLEELREQLQDSQRENKVLRSQAAQLRTQLSDLRYNEKAEDSTQVMMAH
jgi:uncharacterized protein involved in exopolysaccharide biosynthesis